MTCVLPAVGGAEKIKHVVFLYVIKIIKNTRHANLPLQAIGLCYNFFIPKMFRTQQSSIQASRPKS